MKPRFRPAVGILICCAGLAACTATATRGPDTSVTAPSVGRPAPPDSVEAALAKEAFTPYAELGESTGDGLAPGESDFALGAACMAAAGYQDDANDVPMAIRISAGLAFSRPFGSWGYLGIAEAEQYGFLPNGNLFAALGVGRPPGQGFASLSGAAQKAAGKCATIVMKFTNAEMTGSLAGIQTLANDIYNDVLHNPAVQSATKAWSACMAKNGYDYPDPMTAFRKQLFSFAISSSNFAISSSNGKVTDIVASGTGRNPQNNQAQIAAAVTDADCTQSSDLGGIYFAVQASYEQQIVDLNQEQLNSAVDQYRAAYHKELGELSALLASTKDTGVFTITPAQAPAATPTPRPTGS